MIRMHNIYLYQLICLPIYAFIFQVTIRQNVSADELKPPATNPEEILENGVSPLDGILPKDPSFGKVEDSLAELLEKKEGMNGILSAAIKENNIGNHVDYAKMNGDSGKRSAEGNLDSIVPAKKPALEAVVTNGFANGQMNGGGNIKAVLPGGQVVQVVSSSSGQALPNGGQMIQVISSGGGQTAQVAPSGNGQMVQSSGQMVMTSSGQAVILNAQAGGGHEPQQQLIQTSGGQLYLKTSNGGGGIVVASGHQTPATAGGVIVQQSQPQAVVLQQQQPQHQSAAVIVQQQQQPTAVIVQQQPQQQQAVLVQGAAGQPAKMVLIQQDKQQQPQQQYVQQVMQTSLGQQVVRQVLLPGQNNTSSLPTQQLPVTKIVQTGGGGGEPPVIHLDNDPPTVIQRASTPQLTNGQATPPASPSPQPCPSPPPVKIDPARPFLCEWTGCMRPFKTPKEVPYHVSVVVAIHPLQHRDTGIYIMQNTMVRGGDGQLGEKSKN